MEAHRGVREELREEGLTHYLYLGKVCTRGTVGRRGSRRAGVEEEDAREGEAREVVGARGEGVEMSRFEIGTIRSFLAGT